MSVFMSIDDSAHWAVDLTASMLCPLLMKGDGGLLPPPVEGGYAEVVTGGYDTDWSTNAWTNKPVRLLKAALRRVTTAERPMFLGGDRRSMIEGLAVQLSRLDRGLMTGNANCRIVLGPKGSGKTTALQACVIAAQALCLGVVAVYVDVSTTVLTSPMDAVVAAFRNLLPPGTPHTAATLQRLEAARDSTEPVAGVRAVLRDLKLRVFLVLDEFTAAYAFPKPVGFDRWIREVFMLGNCTAGIFLTYVSGSAACLRSLCFGKADAVTAAKFPSYQGILRNLNSSRFQEVTLGPLSTPKDFDEYLRAVGGEHSGLVKAALESSEALNALFCWSGGVLRSVDNCVGRASADEVPAPVEGGAMHKVTSLLGRFQPLWTWLFEKLEERHVLSKAEALLVDDPWALVAEVPIKGPECLPPEPFNTVPALYEATDAGAVVYKQRSGGDSIRFLTPLQPLLLRERKFGECTEWFSEGLRFQLRYPFSAHGTAAEAALRWSMLLNGFEPFGLEGVEGGFLEEVVLELSTAKGDAAPAPKGKGKKKPSAPVSDAAPSPPVFTELHIKTGAKPATPVRALADIPEGIPFRIVPDKLGADIGCRVGSRLGLVQLKLGVSTFSTRDAENVVTRFSGAGALATFLGLVPSKLVRVIAITRPVGCPAKTVCEEAGIALLDRTELSKVWAPCIRAWAQELDVKAYLPFDGAIETDTDGV